MENQHQKITGYRDLTQAEIDLMNEVKAKGEELRALIAKVAAIAAPVAEISDSEAPGELIEGTPMPGIEGEGDDPRYWLRFADGNFRTALMYLVRAIAKPASY